MKFARVLSTAVALWTLFLPVGAAFAQEAEKGNAIEMPRAVRSVAEKTLEAIRNKNAGFLSRLVDPAGIVIGVDSSIMSAKQFKKELAEKRGVYCVIFGDSCSKHSTSLRQLLVNQLVTLRMLGVEGAPKTVAIEIAKLENHNEVLFTLYFRQVGEGWTLQNIEYY